MDTVKEQTGSKLVDEEEEETDDWPLPPLKAPVRRRDGRRWWK